MALLITGVEVDPAGATCTVVSLGGSTDRAKAWGATHFNRRKEVLHLCRVPEGSMCAGPDAHHVNLIGFWPPKTFTGDYVGKHKLRELKKFWEDMEKPDKPAPAGSKAAPSGDAPKSGKLTDRLSILRSKLKQKKPAADGSGRRVHWASDVRDPARPGALKITTPPAIKDEPCLISSGSESASKRKRLTARKSVGAALQQAVALRSHGGAGGTGSLGVSNPAHHQLVSTSTSSHMPKRKKKKKKRGKSKKRKRSHSSSGSSSSSGYGSSSSDGLVPPLQKKAEKKPGSVLKMLMDHVRMALSDMSVLDVGEGDAASSVTSQARVQSYFQVLVRPHLTGRVRDEKELFALARAIDILRSGDLERVADHLAARYMAVETAALEGTWDAAKWLEIDRLEERGAVGPSVLLAARKHQRTVEKAAGRGSFPGTYDPG